MYNTHYLIKVIIIIFHNGAGMIWVYKSYSSNDLINSVCCTVVMTLLIVYMLYSSNDLVNSVCCTVVMTLLIVYVVQ